jgi:radical SAM protein (TIGR01212 family)
VNPWYPERYFAYGPLLRRKFGTRVYKVSVDGGFTCPNRDGSLAFGGCTYCNNESFRPDGAKPTLSVTRQIEGGIAFLRKRFGARKFIAYFQTYSGTYASSERLASLYREALSHPEIVGLSIGTRPDCLSEETLLLLEDLASRCYLTLELGLESVHDRTLAAINRGHDFTAWVEAVRRSEGRGFALATHVILGLPGESQAEMLQSADVVSALPIDFIKIHHLHVVRGTAMARDYRLQPFPTFSLPEYADLLCDYLERLSPRVCVQRLFGLAPEAMILAPRWNLSKNQTLAALKQHMEKRNTWQGKVQAGISAA